MMRFSRLAWLFVSATFTVPQLGAAQTPVVFLQFGSYESKAEANAKLKELSTKHAGILGTMPLAVREVAISEDLNVYRTQAGPLPNRSAAQSVCAQLASNGDECYIVETAISSVLPKATPTPATAASKSPVTPIAEKPPAEAPAPFKHAASDTEGSSASEKIKEPAEKPVAEATPPAAPINMERDAENMQTLAQVTSPAPTARSAAEAAEQTLPEPQVPANTTQETVAAPMSNAMDSALDQAAAQAPTVSEETGKAKLTEAKPKRSFWDSINPFSSDDESTASKAEQPAAAMPAPPPMPETAVESVESAPLADATPAPVTPDSPTAPMVAQAEIPQAPAATEEASAAPTESVSPLSIPTPAAPAPTSAGMALLPPPVPFDATKRAELEQQILGQPAGAAENIATAPVDAATENNNATASTIEEAPSVITAVVPGSGAVQVEEAKRVPISHENKPKKKPAPVISPVVAQSAPTNVPVVRSPSNSMLNKTLWAHIGQFDTPQAALKFWENYRKINPDFPVVRVRVTTSYVAQQSGTQQFSLRIGPFSNQKFVDTLCESNQVRSIYLDCRTVNDMGVSANQHMDRSEQPGVYRAGRYGSTGTGIQALTGFWVQLGAFPTMSMAEEHWKELKKEYETVLSSMQAQVSTPPLGSQSQQVYRLRAGPFVSQSAAEETCTRLLKEKGSCLVVAEQDQGA
jgi:hypothetical protein